MLRKQSSLKQLEIRKKLLIAEAELLRARVGEDLLVVRDGLQAFRDHAKTVSKFASTAAVIMAGVSAFRHMGKGIGGQAVRRSSILSKVLTGARLATGVWRAFKSRQG